jgi:shikimate kinase
MHMSDSNGIRKKRPLIVELAGLAGAGKTTLLEALADRDERIRVAGDLELRKRGHAPTVLRHIPYLLSVLLFRARSSGRFTWDDVKAIVYLKGWPRRLRKECFGSAEVVLLNHGPVFKLATLHAFGPATLRQPRFDRWWSGIFEQWENTLDMVVWLNAPEEMLLERINCRQKGHAIKGKPGLEARCFLARYQTSYEQVLARLTARGGPMIHPVDTSEAPIARTVNDLLAAFQMSVPREIDRVPFSKKDRAAYDLA